MPKQANKIFLAIVILIWVVAIFLGVKNIFFAKPVLAGKDTVTVTKTDTLKVPFPVIKYVKVNSIVAKDSVTVDSVKEKIYADSLSDSTKTGTYKVKHTLVIKQDSLNTAKSFWEVEIHPIEVQITKTIKETITQNIIKEVGEPFYKNVWFYVSAVLTTITILIVR
jgi:hypothetical protein